MDNKNLIKRGSLFYCGLPKKKGSIQRKKRPVMIVQNDVGNIYSPTVIVAPITSVLKKQNIPTHIPIGSEFGLLNDSILLIEQLTTVDKKCIYDFIGVASKEFMRQVDKAIAVSVGITETFNLSEFTACLCPNCLQYFFSSHNYEILRTDKFQKEKSLCTYCRQEEGYNYIISERKTLKTEPNESDIETNI